MQVERNDVKIGRGDGVGIGRWRLSRPTCTICQGSGRVRVISGEITTGERTSELKNRQEKEEPCPFCNATGKGRLAVRKATADV